MPLALFSKPFAQPTNGLEIALDGQTHLVELNRNKRARRYILRVDAARRAIVLTMPARGSLREARRFVAGNEHWLRTQLARLPDAVPFVHGAVIPFRGALHLIRHNPGKGRVVRLVEPGDDALPALDISGDPRHLPRRLTDWLKKQARQDLAARVADYAARLDVEPGKLSLRDPRSRWGSCAANGALSFSWRLVLAPPHVLDYVAAHEVAHLREMNHSADFWTLVAQTCTDTARAKSWLKAHGRGLHGIGASA
jgi:predicted metal-dependent hydrolase